MSIDPSNADQLRLDAEERPAPLSLVLVAWRVLLAAFSFAAGVLVIIIAWSGHEALDGESATTRSYITALAGAGAFLVAWSIKQVLGILTLIGGHRSWAFAELIEHKPAPQRRTLRGTKPEGDSTSVIALRRITDESLIGTVEIDRGRAIRLVEDGIVAIYGKAAVGRRVALGARYGVHWHPAKIR